MTAVLDHTVASPPITQRPPDTTTATAPAAVAPELPGRVTGQMWCGIDWAEAHHDVAVIDADGRQVAYRRVADTAAGFTELLDLLTEHGDTAATPIPVAIETSHGLLVAALRASGRDVYAINPMSAAHYRNRHTVTRKKSDPGDALILANILRTDAAHHRQLPADSENAQAITVLARAQQSAVWDRTTLHLRVRSLLREYYPGALAATAPIEDGLRSAVARELLAVAPTPTRGAALTLTQLRALLRRAGRSRGIDAEAARLRDVLRAPCLHHPPLIETAHGQHLSALLAQFNTACAVATDLEHATIVAFRDHPSAAIITSFPGLGDLLGARFLGEVGDDPTRFTDARGLKAYAGAAPTTRASGRSRSVFARRVKNQRLASVGHQWALSALATSPGAKNHYRQRRDHGDGDPAARRNLFNRFLGMLHHCLLTNQHYQEGVAFPATPPGTERPQTAGAPPPHPRASQQDQPDSTTTPLTP